MKITFNELGAVIETITNDEPLRQGNVGNSITATFNGKDNLYHMATLNFTRADGKTINDVVMKKDLENKEVFTKTFDSEFFFAVSGATTITIYLRNKSGEIVASGRIQFDIEESDYENKAPIDRDQYDELLAYIETKMPIITNVIELEYGEELPLPGETGTMYLVPKTNEKKVFERYWFSPYIDDYVYLGDTSLNLPQYQNRNEKGQANGYAPLDKDKYVPLTHLPGSFKELSKYPTYDDFPRPPASAIKNNLFVALDTRYEYVWLDELDDYLLLDESFSDAGSVNYDPVDSEGLKANNVKTALDELSKTKLNIKPLVWSALPEGAVDKKTFYNKTIATLRTANSKIYLYGTPEETPIKEFFEIWGKPTDFKATHVYITIASVSNETKRDSFMMIIHSSNYANMYYMVVNGYNSQLVGNGSGWVSFNLLSAERQKQLAKIDGYYELMVVGYALGLIDPDPSKPTIGTFTTRETAGGQEIENDTATIVNEIGGNTIAGTNLCDKQTLSYETDEKLFALTDFIEIIPNQEYSIKNFGMRDNVEYVDRMVQVFDKDKIRISIKQTWNGLNKTVQFSVEPNAKYIKVVYHLKTQGMALPTNPQIMIALGNKELTEYDPFIYGNLYSATPKTLTSTITRNLLEPQQIIDNIKKFVGGASYNEATDELKWQGVNNDDKLAFKTLFKPNTQYRIAIDGFNTTSGYANLEFEYTDGTVSPIYMKQGTTRGIASTNSQPNKTIKRIKGGWYDGVSHMFPKTTMLYIGTEKIDFEPYEVDTLATEFENYATEMRGVNNIRDTLTKKAYTKKVALKSLADNFDSWVLYGVKGLFQLPLDIRTFDTGKGKLPRQDLKPNALMNLYQSQSIYDVLIDFDNCPNKTFAIYDVDGYIYIKDTDYANNLSGFKNYIKKAIILYELAEPVITPINPERAMAYKVQNKGIESWDSEVPVYTNIVYAHNLANKLKSLRSYERQKEIDDRQDSDIANLKEITNHLSLHDMPLIFETFETKADKTELKSYNRKYHYIGNIHDIELYNQLLAVDDIAKGALFSVEIANDTTKAELNKGFPNLKQGSMVYGWFTQDELGQPMNIVTEKGMFKVIDGGTLTCEVIDGEDFDIEYRVASQHQFNISTPQLAHLIKGLRVWYQYEFQGRKRLQHQDIYFTDKGDTDATSYISNGLNIVGFLADTIAIEFDMSTGVIALRSTGTMPQTFKLIDLKGLR